LINNINLNELKTKNLKKKQVEVKPVHPPLMIEREYHNEIRAFNVEFKKAIRNIIFPMIQSYSKITKDSLTHDGIGADIEKAIALLLTTFNFNYQAERIASNMVTRVSSVNGKKTTQRINNAIGVDVGNIIKGENLSEFVEMQSIKNSQLIKSVPDDAIEDIRRIVLNGLSEGLRAEEIAKQISGNNPSSVFNKMNNRINTIARTEVAKLNSQITNKRLSNLGIVRAVWDATLDNRVRECHRARDGKEYDISVGLYSGCDGKTLQPAEEINCRCVARPIVD